MFENYLILFTGRRNKDYLERVEFEPYSFGTILDKEKHYQLIEQARKEGYTISRSELESHTVSVAASIFDHTGKITAGLSIAGIEANYGEENVRRFSQKAIEAANKISEGLGYVRN